MLLMAVFVLANTVSADGSISGVYSASLRLAEQSRTALVGGQRESEPPAKEKTESSGQPKEQPKPSVAPNKNRQNKP
jgi:hypothetical protein